MAHKQGSAAVGRPSPGRLAALIIGVLVFVVGMGVVLAPVLTTERTPASLPGASPRTSTTPSASPTPGADTPVPAPAPLDAPLDVRVLFGLQSIGYDIVNGVPKAFTSAGLARPKVIKWSAAAKTKGPFLATASIGRDGDPRSKLKAFADLVNEAPRGSAQVALMAFNYQDISAEADVDSLFQSYLATMDSLETANPDITLLYSTVPVTAGNSWREVEAATVEGLSGVTQPVWQDNIARERFNTMIRQQYAASGRLFDIAALQADLGDGKVAAKQHENQLYYVLNPELSSNGRRLNARGSRELATQLMMLVAAASRD